MGLASRFLLLVAATIPAVAGAGGGPAPGDVTVTPIVSSGLVAPIGVFASPDATGRLFVNQQDGAIRVIRNGTLLATPFLTISSSTQCADAPGGPLLATGFVSGGEQGLLALAFHPRYEANGRFFVSYTGANGDTIVARYRTSAPTADVVPTADLASCVVVLRVDQDFPNHNGGNIVFGPDGFLYFGLGDGGSGNDPCNRGQTLSPTQLPANDANDGGCPADAPFVNAGGNPDSRALLGKMLRLDVDGTTPAGANELCGSRPDGAANYAIPPTNPFAGVDGQTRCDETFSYGLRNPWRWSFDRATADLIIADVGQRTWEEVNLVTAASGGGNGVNFDWKICEGRHLRGTCSNLCTETSEVIIAYNNFGATSQGCAATTAVTGCSITGGYRYRGPDPLLQGVYFYGDACGDDLYYSVDTGGNSWVEPSATTTVAAIAGGAVVAFGEDVMGAVYMVGGGRVSRIGAAPLPVAVFADGFEN
jgi:glucose/arabinose dehydrogenase